MISNIINQFSEQAREHKVIKSFCYACHYDMGSGKDIYPLFWLESPMGGKNQNNLFTNVISFSILMLPQQGLSLSELQNLAFSSGLNIIERIKQDKNSSITIRPDWTYTTLSEYYDDDACGCRFSLNVQHTNMQDLCLIEEQFDADKELSTCISDLPQFEVYPNKLPNFSLRTRKK